MNPLKHMELIFGIVVTAALLMAASSDRASAADPRAVPTAAVNQPIARAGLMAVVIVPGKRLSSREKRRIALSDAGGLHIF